MYNASSRRFQEKFIFEQWMFLSNFDVFLVPGTWTKAASRQEGEAGLSLGNTQTQELVIGNWVLDNGIDISWEHSRGGF